MQAGYITGSIVHSQASGLLIKRFPNVQILHNLLLAARFLGFHPNRIARQGARNTIVGLLEGAAVMLESDMPRFARVPNLHLQKQVQQNFAESAAALRIMGLQLTLADDGTSAKVRDEVTNFKILKISSAIFNGAAPAWFGIRTEMSSTTTVTCDL
jgi:hypothetical protein